MPTLRTLKLAVMAIAVFYASAITAGEYYRWMDEQGVTHYGSTPPQGVDAELVSTYDDAPTKEPKSSENDIQRQQQAMRNQREQECASEKSRLSTLKTSGTRIRMRQEDGSSRYLTADEIQKEIEQSEQFIKEACDN